MGQTEFEVLQDAVYASMETGNFDRARTLMYEAVEYIALDDLQDLKINIITDYGVSL